MLNHEKNELENFVEKYGVVDVVQTLGDIFDERSRTEKDPDIRALNAKYAKRLQGTPTVTEENLVETLRQCRELSSGRLKEALSTKRIQDELSLYNYS